MGNSLGVWDFGKEEEGGTQIWVRKIFGYLESKMVGGTFGQSSTWRCMSIYLGLVGNILGVKQRMSIGWALEELNNMVFQTTLFDIKQVRDQTKGVMLDSKLNQIQKKYQAKGGMEREISRSIPTLMEGFSIVMLVDSWISLCSTNSIMHVLWLVPIWLRWSALGRIWCWYRGWRER